MSASGAAEITGVSHQAWLFIFDHSNNPSKEIKVVT
jgi:hypothetical protein